MVCACDAALGIQEERMGVIDTVTGEVTKWLLSKIDGLFANRESTYKEKAEDLYEMLCLIDDELSKSAESPEEVDLNGIEFSIKKMKEIPDEFWYSVAMYSTKEKSF